jgi:cobalt/nickel transport system permease protein
MHIPENYLSPATCAVMALAAAPALAVCVKKAREETLKEAIPMLGIGAAFSFLLMMFNLPLPGGTTGHAVGGALIAVLVGPWAAALSVTAALAIQALLFGDGGVLSLGANIFNIAIILPFVGHFVYRITKNAIKSPAGEHIGVALGAYIGLNAAALATAIEFGIQPFIAQDAAGLPLYCPYPLSVAIPAMLIPHLAVAGIAEAVFSVSIFSFIKRVSPGSIYHGEKKNSKLVYAFMAVLICLVPLGLIAQGTAWGEWGAEEIAEVSVAGAPLGFIPGGMENGFDFSAIMPDYVVPGLPEAAGYIVSALFGVGLSIILFRLISGFFRGKQASSAA